LYSITIHKKFWNLPQDLELEIRIIKTFVLKDKQKRFIQFVQSNKNRQKFIRELAHFSHFETKLFTRLDGNKTHVIDAVGRSNNLKDNCYVISESVDFDRKVMPLDEALELVVGYQMGTILVLNQGRNIYYEGEGQNECYLSKPA